MRAARSEHADFGLGATAGGRGTGGASWPTRNTPRQRALLEVLESADEFLSAADLHDRLAAYLAPHGLRVGIATVYGQLRRLGQSDAVDSLRSADGETLYWRPRRDGHHHYLVCRSCGRAVEIIAEPVEELANEVGASFGFRDVTHSFAVFGLCDRCEDSEPLTDAQRR